MPEYLFHILPLSLMGLPLFFFSKSYLKKHITSSGKLFLVSALTAVVLSVVIYSGLIAIIIIYAMNKSEF